MPWVRVKEGCDYRTEAGLVDGGAVLEVTEAEAASFGDKFEPADAPALEADGGGAAGAEPEPASPPAATGALDVTDAARELAAEEGVDLYAVEGTGQDGRITVGDVRRHLEG